LDGQGWKNDLKKGARSFLLRGRCSNFGRGVSSSKRGTVGQRSGKRTKKPEDIYLNTGLGSKVDNTNLTNG